MSKRRLNLLASFFASGRREEAKRMLSESIVRNRGVLLQVAGELGVDPDYVRGSIDRLGLRSLLDASRLRADAPPRWLVRTLAVIEGGLMSQIEQLYQAAKGMSIEEIAAEIDASVHAGKIDSMTLAEALAMGAESMPEE